VAARAAVSIYRDIRRTTIREQASDMTIEHEISKDIAIPALGAVLGGSRNTWMPEMRDFGFKGRTLSLKFLTPTFPRWTGPDPTLTSATLRSKPLVAFDGKAAFAELAVVGELERAGWNAVWIDCFHRRMRRSMNTGESLSAFVERSAGSSEADSALGALVRAKNGKLGGLWDVFAWKGRQSAFFETKRRANDRLRTSQLETYAIAQIACPKLQFFVVEWDWAT